MNRGPARGGLPEKLTQLATDGDLQGVQALLAVETEFSAPNKESAFYGAVSKGHRDVADFLLNIAGKEISPEYKWTALHSAIKNGYIDLVLQLLPGVKNEFKTEHFVDLFISIVKTGILRRCS